MRLFILLPLDDQSSAIEPLLARLGIVAQQHSWSVHVVVVDDRSARGSAFTAPPGLQVEVIAHRYPRGLRETLRDGIEWISERCGIDDVVLLFASPDESDVVAMPLMLAALETGADVTVASAGSARRRGSSERFAAFTSRLPARIFFRIPGVRDPLSPTLALRGSTLQRVIQGRRDTLLSSLTPAVLLPLELLSSCAADGARCSQVDVPTDVQPKVAGDPLPPMDLARATLKLSVRLRDRDAPPLQPRVPDKLPRWEWAALGGLLFAALMIRLYALQRVPEVVFHDECDNLVNVYQIMNGRGPGFFGFDWKPQPAASIYILTAFMRMGMSVLTLRLPAALYSVLALIPFYVLMRRAVAMPAAFSATALLATDLWYLHFSRTGWENVSTCIFLVAAALTIRDALWSGRMRSFAWTGVWCALGAYSYFAGRAVFPAVVLACLNGWRRPRIPRTTIVSGLILTTLVAVALFGPQLPNIMRNWELFQKRSRTVSLLARSEGVANATSMIVRSFGTKASELFVGRETPDRYLRMDPGPLLTPIVLLLGVGLGLSFWWRQETGLWWIFLLVPFVLTQVLTTGDLNGARGVIFVPILYLFVGLTIHAMLQAATSIARPLAGLVLAVVLVTAVTSTYTYFKWVQSPRLVQDLYPSFPVAEFPAWQAHVLEWTKHTDDFFNVYMWEEAKRKAAPAPAQ